jgi:hypothetical protein
VNIDKTLKDVLAGDVVDTKILIALLIAKHYVEST